MNQVLKDVVYSLGTQKQVNFMAFLGGMNETEKKIFHMIHEGKTDLCIQTELCLSKEAYKQHEMIMRRKLVIAIFNCIDYRIDNFFEDNDIQ